MRRAMWVALYSMLILSGCGGGQSDFTTSPGNGGGGNTGGDNTGGNGMPPMSARLTGASMPGKTVQDASNVNEASCARKANLTGGTHRQVTLTSESGETISFEVIEPLAINCTSGNPLVLHGHGFGGQRVQDPASDGLIDRLRKNGYAVISIDQRGFNDSTGTVRVMDPNFEGKDLLQILDWAERHLDYLAFEPSNGALNLVAGATGGSYGGMYQLLIHNIDIKRRLDALTPDITPNDLRYSLNPGNVIKSGWAQLLVVGGETGANQPVVRGLDPVVKETLVQGTLTNVIPAGALPFFFYHSVQYFLDGANVKQDPITFVSSMGGQLSTGFDYLFKGPPKPVDILFSQGVRDTLFNLNEAINNFNGYRALGGDVRLMTHETGHLLPAPIQAAGGKFACGSLNRNDAVIAFLNEKLRPPMRETLSPAILASVEQLRGGFVGGVEKPSVCLALADDDVILVEPSKLRQVAMPIAFDGSGSVTPNGAPAAITTQLAGGLPLPIPTTNPVPPTFIKLLDVPPGGKVLAGVAQLDAVLSSVGGEVLSSVLPADGCAVGSAAPPESPVNGCDAIAFVGLGVRTAGGTPRLVDDQVRPLRGLGAHKVDLVAVAERLREGEELGLLVYGFQQQYHTSFSRDIAVPFFTLSGSVALPLR